jgi:hypothetical protein
MLLTNEVFNRVWGAKAGTIPKTEYWEEVIPAIRKKYPNFIFIAEVYWDMEWKLQQQGFDYCYDKRLYDRMLNDNAQSIKAHLNAEWEYQQKLVRFIENHDEKRAITVFGEEKSRATAILALTLPGARLIFDGQMNGYRIRTPIQLGRSPIETDNQNMKEFYLRLLNAAPDRKFESGKWSLCRVNSVGNDISYENLIAYIWVGENQKRLIVVNFSPYLTQGHIRIKGLNYGFKKWTFTNLLTQEKYTYKGEDLDNYGLYVKLSAWEGQIFDINTIY